MTASKCPLGYRAEVSRRGYMAHRSRQETACSTCRESSRAYDRVRHAAKAVSIPGRPKPVPTPTAASTCSCGIEGPHGRAAHRRVRERPAEPDSLGVALTQLEDVVTDVRRFGTDGNVSGLRTALYALMAIAGDMAAPPTSDGQWPCAVDYPHTAADHDPPAHSSRHPPATPPAALHRDLPRPHALDHTPWTPFRPVPPRAGPIAAHGGQIPAHRLAAEAAAWRNTQRRAQAAICSGAHDPADARYLLAVCGLDQRITDPDPNLAEVVA